MDGPRQQRRHGRDRRDRWLCYDFGDNWNADARAGRLGPRRPREHELAAQSELGPLGRAIYRWFRAWRPVPARLESALYAAIFRTRG